MGGVTAGEQPLNESAGCCATTVIIANCAAEHGAGERLCHQKPSGVQRHHLILAVGPTGL